MTLQAPLIKGEKKSETCEEQLRRMCKSIAEDMTEGDRLQANSYMEKNVYDIEWITHQDHSYKAARLLVAGGGPTIWVNLNTGYVEGYWGGDKVEHPFTDNLGLDDYCEEMYGCA